MSRLCQVTGRHPAFGNNVSHSQRRTRRRFDPNIQRKRYWLPSEQRFFRLRVSAKGMRIIDRRGIESVAAGIRARGEKVRPGPAPRRFTNHRPESYRFHSAAFVRGVRRRVGIARNGYKWIRTRRRS